MLSLLLTIFGYISAEESKKLSAGDVVYIKAFNSFDGNGVVKSKQGDMVIVNINDINGAPYTLNIHWGWIGAIITDVPEMAISETPNLKTVELQADMQKIKEISGKW